MRIDSPIPWMAGILAATLAPPLAQAHVGVEQASGLLHGIAHPVTGLDHIAAMVAVGLWAAQCGGRAIWLVPLSFVTAMSVGGLTGVAGIPFPLVQPGIAASVLVLGLLVATASRFTLIASGTVIGLFAVFHGHAHGTEMPETVTGLAYGVGFVLSTGLLHGCGIALGQLAQKLGSPDIIRYAGGVAVALGFYLLR